MCVIIDPIHVPRKRFLSGSYPSVITVNPWSPPGIWPCPSAMTQTPPSDRTRSDPVTLPAGLSPLSGASASYVHSPTSLCSHSCSFCGVTFGISCGGLISLTDWLIEYLQHDSDVQAPKVSKFIAARKHSVVR